MHLSINIAVVLLMICPLDGFAIIEIKLKTFSNPEGLDVGGECCDHVCALGACLCYGECDHRLLFCLDQLRNPANTDHTTCSIGSYSTSEYDNDNHVEFGTVSISGHMTEWQGTVVFKTRVLDEEFLGGDELVDDFYMVLTVPSPSSADNKHWYTKTFTGRRHHSPTSLSFDYSVYCAAGWGGSNCNQLITPAPTVTSTSTTTSTTTTTTSSTTKPSTTTPTTSTVPPITTTPNTATTTTSVTTTTPMTTTPSFTDNGKSPSMKNKTTEEGATTSNSLYIYVGIGVGAGLAVIPLVALLVVLYRKRTNNSTDKNGQESARNEAVNNHYSGEPGSTDIYSEISPGKIHALAGGKNERVNTPAVQRDTNHDDTYIFMGSHLKTKPQGKKDLNVAHEYIRRDQGRY